MSFLRTIRTLLWPERAAPRLLVCAGCGKPFDTTGRLKANPYELETYWTEKYCTRECGDEARGGGQALADAMDASSERFDKL